MKKLITSYNFDSINKKIILNEYTSIKKEGVLLITNVTNNVIIYNFANSSLGGTVSGNTIILSYNTTTMSNSDNIMILYDDGDDNDRSDRTQNLLKEILEELKNITMLLDLKS